MNSSAVSLQEIVESTVEAQRGKIGALMPVLHSIQEKLGYIPAEAVPMIGRLMNLSRAEIHGVISFYHDFRSEPAGDHVIHLCRAEACQAMGSAMLEQHARLIMTDSGGIQKEAYFFGIPCVTLREETEWVELVEQGCNILAGNNPQRIYEAYSTMVDISFDVQPDFYGGGKTAERIAQLLEMESGKT